MAPNERQPLLRNENPTNDSSSDVAVKDAGDLRAEFKLLCEYSVPLIATYLLQYSATVITTVVAGRLGADELAAASVGLTTMNIIGFAFLEGMATALDTLCAQAYGSGHLVGVGLHAQRMFFLMILAMIPIGTFWIFSPHILTGLVNQHHVAVSAGRFLQVSLIGLPGYGFFEIGKRFLQAQGDFRAAMVILVVCTPINGLLGWLFAIKLDLGVEGAALAQAVSNNLRLLMLVVHVYFAKWSHKCWGGWSWNALKEWGVPLRLSIAGTAVNMAEWLAFEILMISTSYLGTKHLAAQTILNTISIITWHIPFSISVAVSTRVGIFVGAGLLDVARRMAHLYTVIFIIVGLFDGALLFLLRHQLSSVFSTDPVVLRLATNAMLSVSAFQIIDAINSGLNGFLRGLGLQSVAAFIVLVVNIFTVPFALWLELGYPDMKLDGLWVGLGAGMVLIAVMECVYLKWVSWKTCVESIKAREEGH